jgi:hypothetical protein
VNPAPPPSGLAWYVYAGIAAGGLLILAIVIFVVIRILKRGDERA